VHEAFSARDFHFTLISYCLFSYQLCNLIGRYPFHTNARIVVNGDRVDLSAVKKVMSPYDEFAVEIALQHREAAGGEVTAVTVGGAGADKVLKDAKAIGVDNIVRIDSEEALDSNALQHVLSATISQLGAEVVYCGKSAADTGAGSTGPGLAERLGWASVSNAINIVFGGEITAEIPSAGGATRYSVPLPAVISCDKGGLKVRKPNVKGIMQAKKAKVEVHPADAPASAVTVVNHSMPPAKPAGKSYQGGAAAAEVAQLLRDEANVI
jgi:electron transfer flavoprotein beta subunit